MNPNPKTMRQLFDIQSEYLCELLLLLEQHNIPIPNPNLKRWWDGFKEFQAKKESSPQASVTT